MFPKEYLTDSDKLALNNELPDKQENLDVKCAIKWLGHLSKGQQQSLNKDPFLHISVAARVFTSAALHDMLWSCRIHNIKTNETRRKNGVDDAFLISLETHNFFEVPNEKPVLRESLFS